MTWGDEAAFTAFYGRTARALWAYVYRTTGNAADADDIVQEAFCRIVTAGVESLDDEDRRRYLFRTASNLMVDRWRRATREKWGRESFVEDTALVSSTNDSRPHFPDLDTAATFAGLKPRDRALLWLAYVEEHDHQAIARALGVGRASVKVLLSRARARLRDLLEARGMLGGRHG